MMKKVKEIKNRLFNKKINKIKLNSIQLKNYSLDQSSSSK